MDISTLYQNCRLCPRACGVDRLAGSDGFCGESSQLKLAFAGLHRGEEPPLSGKGGSGTIFVSGCNLGCIFCQNWQISGGGQTVKRHERRQDQRLGRIVSTDEFTAICLKLQKSGAENINMVTGSHAVPAIVQGLIAAKAAGLNIPVLWNSSGYESLETLELLNGHIDTYMPDLKTLDSSLAAKFFNVPDYPQAASQAILWMMRHRPQQPCHVIIRHLILPGHLESTRAVLRWFADNARGSALLSLMSQYTPIKETNGLGYSSLVHSPGRFLSKREYETVMGWLEELGIEDGFCQELLTGSDWLPDFNRCNPFSSDLSVAVWHFMDVV
ncbi:MAG: radical SAM protein [Treponema sp.]|jgi:putative pyruvate formate lyase activating enzyme|nr:radical SAM protein [Treponema sp.]